MKLFNRNTVINFWTILFIGIISLYAISIILWFSIEAIGSSASSETDAGALLDQLNSDLPMILPKYLWIQIGIYLNFFSLLILKPAYMFKKRYKKIGFFFVIIDIFYIARIVFKKIKYNFRYLNIFNYIMVGILSTVPFIYMSQSFKKSIDDPTTSYKRIGFSLNSNTPNVIEIFSDGLDANNILEVRNSWKLNGFSIFPNLVSEGFYTENGLDGILKGNSKDTTRQILKNRLEHYETKKSNYQKTIINCTDIWTPNRPDTYVSGWSGNGKQLEKELPGINILNWSAARKEVSNSNIVNKSVFAFGYEALKQGIHESNKPSYTQIMENITHHPINVSSTGALFPIFNFKSSENANEYIVNTLKEIKEKLEKIRDATGWSAYDNTLIVVYGDHASHGRVQMPHKYANGYSRKNISALLIKPLSKIHSDSNSKFRIRKGVSLYSVGARKVVESQIDGIDLDVFLKSKDKQFNIKRPFVTWTGKGDRTGWLFHIQKLSNNSNFSRSINFTSYLEAKDSIKILTGNSIVNNSKESGWLHTIINHNGWFKESSDEGKWIKGVVEWK